MINKKKCRICGGMAVLMKIVPLPPYYYHYPEKDSCKQRLSQADEKLLEWTKDDEIKNLIKLLRSERKMKNRCLEIMTKDERLILFGFKGKVRRNELGKIP